MRIGLRTTATGAGAGTVELLAARVADHRAVRRRALSPVPDHIEPQRAEGVHGPRVLDAVLVVTGTSGAHP
ncbi:hypothetical protein ABZT27_32730 [Streptomyces sp. NPDC005389]|uniref:hypothetical protein n=1 Tax=Streptomyces sp. NPDC005389 TaxID=3157040 RepID=UPI0033AA1401